MTDFDAVIDSMQRDGDVWSVNPGDDWRQGRTLFGGMSAALCFAACEKLVDNLPPLRAGFVSFIGPSAGEARLVPTLLRSGKSVTFMGCDLVTSEGVATRAVFTFGAARASALSGRAPRAPSVLPATECAPLFGERKPNFTAHFDQRIAGGKRIGSGAEEGDLMVWVRHAEPVRPSGAALIALGDALPPASMPRVTGPVIISTMTWAFDLFNPERHDGTGWHLMRSTDDEVKDGYAGQTMRTWSETGDPILIARQSVAIFG